MRVQDLIVFQTRIKLNPFPHLAEQESKRTTNTRNIIFASKTPTTRSTMSISSRRQKPRGRGFAVLFLLALSAKNHAAAFTTFTPTIIHGRSTSRCHAAKTDEELLPIVREEINERGFTEAWDACVGILSKQDSMALSSRDEAEILLSAALQWRGYARVSSALARKYMKPREPNPQQLKTALDWLLVEGPLTAITSSWSPLELLQAVQAAPTVYLVDPAKAYDDCLQSAPKPYNTPETLLELVRDDPTALLNNFNCADIGCNSECGTCWVSYGIRRGKQVANF